MSGFSITVNGTPVALTGGTIVGNKVIFTAASEIYPNDTVLGSYDAGAGDIQGESSPLASFTSQPATNGSGAIPPGASYPLNDDGTFAAQFGISVWPTDAPAFMRAAHTYTGAAGGSAIAGPTLANAYGSQAVTVGAGKILALEAVIEYAPDTGDYEDITLLPLFSSGGTPYAAASIYIRRRLGVDTWSAASIAGDQPRTSPAAGFRIGVELNGATGEIIYRTTDGSVVSDATFTPGDQVTGALSVQDEGVTAAGKTCAIRFLLADEMTLPFTAGAVDFNGDVIA